LPASNYLTNREKNSYISSRESSDDYKTTHYSTRSVDHVRDYMQKKKIKDEIFQHIQGHSNIIEFEKLLKSNNPDMNCRNEEWKTPLHVVAELNMSTAWVNTLIRYGADINR